MTFWKLWWQKLFDLQWMDAVLWLMAGGISFLDVQFAITMVIAYYMGVTLGIFVGWRLYGQEQDKKSGEEPQGSRASQGEESGEYPTNGEDTGQVYRNDSGTTPETPSFGGQQATYQAPSVDPAAVQAEVERLEALGSPEAIAAELRPYMTEDNASCPTRCPVALDIKDKLGIQSSEYLITVGTRTVNVWGRNQCRVDLGPMVTKFIEQYDSHKIRLL